MADLDTLRMKLNEQARYYQTVILLPNEWATILAALDENERLRAERDMWKGRAETSVDIARALQGKEPKYGTITGAGPHPMSRRAAR